MPVRFLTIKNLEKIIDLQRNINGAVWTVKDASEYPYHYGFWFATYSGPGARPVSVQFEIPKDCFYGDGYAIMNGPVIVRRFYPTEISNPNDIVDMMTEFAKTLYNK
jgi:hypothetical protein